MNVEIKNLLEAVAELEIDGRDVAFEEGELEIQQVQVEGIPPHMGQWELRVVSTTVLALPAQFELRATTKNRVWTNRGKVLAVNTVIKDRTKLSRTVIVPV